VLTRLKDTPRGRSGEVIQFVARLSLAAVLLVSCRGLPPTSSPTPVTGGATPLRTPTSSDASVAPEPPARGDLTVTVVQAGLSVPWDIAFAPDGRMLVTERSGAIRVYESGEPNAGLIEQVSVPDLRPRGESGLMGIAVDMDFGQNPFVYVCASRDPDGEDGPAQWVNQLLRYNLGEDSTLEFDSVLFEQPPRANRQHNGCALEMDSDRKIWMTVGDALKAAANIPQDPTSLNGKILRINADGSVPGDNPVFEGTAAPTMVYSLGHRNPQGIAFHPESGHLYATEHGTGINDEINRIVPGGNYGWPCYTGVDGEGQPDVTDCPPHSAFRPPAWASGEPTLAVSGSTFLSGDLWGDWQNSFVVACLKERDLRRFVVSADGETVEMADVLLNEQFGRLRAAVLAPDGALYVTTSNQANASGADGSPQPDLQRDVIIRIAPNP
jgi:glucose/arabinose dehydrogenase